MTSTQEPTISKYTENIELKKSNLRAHTVRSQICYIQHLNSVKISPQYLPLLIDQF
jgi:hypothetical protein